MALVARARPSPDSGTAGMTAARRSFRELAGLAIFEERAAKLLALANALLKGCARLEALDLTAKGGSGPLAPWGGVK
jgi:hypothetical protein